MALNHDTVFLAELLSALSTAPEMSAAYRSFNCMTMPKKGDEMPAVLRYSSAATLVLAEFKIIDHVEDTGKRRWRGLARFFSPAFRKAEADLQGLGFPVDRLRKALGTQSAREREGKSIADFAAPTAEATALFFAHGAQIIGLAAASTLSALGWNFGELAYLIDALEDYEKDRTSGSFNAIRTAHGLDRSQALPNEIRREVVVELQRLAEAIRIELEQLPLTADAAAGFASRLKANLDAKLGLKICSPRHSPVAKRSRKERWADARAFAKRISANSPKWRASMTVALVAAVAYVVPTHSRAATTPSECLSLGFNLMALGSVFAMATSGTPPPILPPADPNVFPGQKLGAPGPKVSRSGGGGGGNNCGCCCDSDCCDSCNCACCACESCEICSSCGECCSGCGDCGSCCSGCGDCCSGCDC
jgi:hypothetical protein